MHIQVVCFVSLYWTFLYCSPFHYVLPTLQKLTFSCCVHWLFSVFFPICKVIIVVALFLSLKRSNSKIVEKNLCYCLRARKSDEVGRERVFKKEAKEIRTKALQKKLPKTFQFCILGAPIFFMYRL